MLFRSSIKTICLIAAIFFSFNTKASNYFISNSGNDSKSGTSPAAAWQSLNRLNSFKNLNPGDSILFRRGDSFYGTIMINSSGAINNPVVYSAYGEGPKPIITGLKLEKEWKNLGSNIWESKNVESTLSYTNMVVVNNKNTAMGKYPNSGYTVFSIKE